MARNGNVAATSRICSSSAPPAAPWRDLPAGLRIFATPAPGTRQENSGSPPAVPMSRLIRTIFCVETVAPGANFFICFAFAGIALQCAGGLADLFFGLRTVGAARVKSPWRSFLSQGEG
jgi:hypothetical protein